jgi:hypothetical protein
LSIYFVYNRLTDGGDVVSLIHLSCSARQKHILFLSLVLISVRG